LTCFRFDISHHIQLLRYYKNKKRLGDKSPSRSPGYQSPLLYFMYLASSFLISSHS